MESDHEFDLPLWPVGDMLSRDISLGNPHTRRSLPREFDEPLLHEGESLEPMQVVLDSHSLWIRSVG